MNLEDTMSYIKDEKDICKITIHINCNTVTIIKKRNKTTKLTLSPTVDKVRLLLDLLDLKYLVELL